jgi:hypothetical protein
VSGASSEPTIYYTSIKHICDFKQKLKNIILFICGSGGRTVEGGLAPIDKRIMPVDSHRAVIVRNGKMRGFLDGALARASRA